MSNKFFGKVGFVTIEEKTPGVWEEVATEREYFGDIQSNRNRFQSTEHLNDNINISNEISIVSDDYACRHTNYIRYIIFMGSPWQVTSVDVKYPRLVLSIGGVYNGPQASTAFRAC